MTSLLGDEFPFERPKPLRGVLHSTRNSLAGFWVFFKPFLSSAIAMFCDGQREGDGRHLYWTCSTKKRTISIIRGGVVSISNRDSAPAWKSRCRVDFPAPSVPRRRVWMASIRRIVSIRGKSPPLFEKILFLTGETFVL